MKQLLKKEWRLTVPPMPLVFLLLSGLTLIPNYPYFITFFYTALGVFFYFQAARENNDTAYMLLLPVSKRQMVKARVLTVCEIELLQLLACVPFMILRASYGEIKNAVGIEANIAFLGCSALLLGCFNFVFLPMHYKNGYDIGKPFVIGASVLTVLIVALEILSHVLPYMATVCDSYAPADQLAQIPVLLGGLLAYAALTLLAEKQSEKNFEKTDL